MPPVSKLPARWRMVVRGIGRNKRRSLSTGVGVVLALTLVLASWGMVDTVDILVDRQFNQVQRQDAQVFLESVDAGVLADIESVPGVERVEPAAQVPVTVRANGHQYTTELVAFDPATEMHDFGADGLPATGLVAGRSLASILDIAAGDTVSLQVTDAAADRQVPISAFLDEPLGTFVYAGLPAVEASVSEPIATSVMVTFADGVDRAAMREALSDRPGVVAYVDSKGLYETVRSLLSLFYAFVGVMVLFGAVMAFALLFNTSAVNVAERSPELAAMHVNGASSGQLARLLAGETMLLTVISIIPGLVVGYWVSAQLMGSFSSDLFDFSLEMRRSTLAFAALAILAVSAIVQWPTTRAVNRLDIASVVRERSR